MNRTGATHRVCFTCGATGEQAIFATRRKGYGRRDYCAIHANSADTATVLSRRVCYDCGATRAEAAFAGDRKPRKRRDQCTDCAANPLEVSAERIAARRARIAALQLAGRYRAPKPSHTLPLFAALKR